ncbi:MAG: hypothetical protein QM698_14145 [Micropepsaceae bacterium]
MLKQIFAAVLSAACAVVPALASETKADRASIDRVMADWTPEARADAEKLMARYGLPDRVTETILIWDVQSAAQQQAMVDMTGGGRTTAEAGDDGSGPSR